MKMTEQQFYQYYEQLSKEELYKVVEELVAEEREEAYSNGSFDTSFALLT